MKAYFLFCLFLISNIFIYAQSPFGINLAGAEFGENFPGTVNQDFTYPTEEELIYFHSKGLNLVRFPFKWERVQKTLNGELDNDELQRMKDFVQLADKLDIKILLDLHNYCRYNINGTEHIIGTDQIPIENIKDFWTKLAFEFKDEKNIWGYGIMNEPNNMPTKTAWFEIAQKIIDGIRTVDQETPIVVGGDSWSSAERWLEESDNLKDLNDPSKKIIFEAHVYFDKNASGVYAKNYDDDEAYPELGMNRVQPFIDWLNINDFHGFIGEYGIPDDDDRWLIVLDKFLNHLTQNCINGTYWAAGPWWGDPNEDVEYYHLSIERKLDGADRTQMSIVKNYLETAASCPIVNTELSPSTNSKVMILTNPFSNQIRLNTETKDQIVVFYNSTGIEIMHRSIQNAVIPNLDILSTGIYFLKFENGDALKAVKF